MEKKTGRGVQKWTFKGQCDVVVSLPPPGRPQTFLVFTFMTATIASWEIFGPCDLFPTAFLFFAQFHRVLSNSDDHKFDPHPIVHAQHFLTVDPQRERERDWLSKNRFRHLVAKISEQKSQKSTSMQKYTWHWNCKLCVFLSFLVAIRWFVWNLHFSMDFQKAHKTTPSKSQRWFHRINGLLLFFMLFFVPGGDPKHWFGFLVSRRGCFFWGVWRRCGFGSVERKVWRHSPFG